MLTFEDFEALHEKYAEETALREKHHHASIERALKPDADLRAYLSLNKEAYRPFDILAVLAAVPGERGTGHWHWFVQLKSGLFAYTEAWCDRSGWDTACGGKTTIGDDMYKVIDVIASIDALANILRQLRGEQAIGTKRMASTLNYPDAEPVNYYQFFDF